MLEHVRQSRPDAGLGVQVDFLKTCSAVLSSLGSGILLKQGAEIVVHRKHRLRPDRRERKHPALRRSLKLSQSKSKIFKTVSQELCPRDGRSCHIVADGRRPCDGAWCCWALSFSAPAIFFELFAAQHRSFLPANHQQFIIIPDNIYLEEERVGETIGVSPALRSGSKSSGACDLMCTTSC